MTRLAPERVEDAREDGSGVRRSRRLSLNTLLATTEERFEISQRSG